MDFVDDDYDEKLLESKTDKELKYIVLSQTKPTSERIDAMNELHHRNPQTSNENVLHILQIYNMFPTAAYEDYLYELCIKSRVNFFSKVMIGESIHENWKELDEISKKDTKDSVVTMPIFEDENDVYGCLDNTYDCDTLLRDDERMNQLEEYWKLIFFTLSKDCEEKPFAIQIKIYRLLSQADEYYNHVVSGLTRLTNEDINNNCEFRYRSIAELGINKNIMYDVFCNFIENKNNMTVFRILSCQYVLQNINKSDKIQDYLTLIAKDEKLSENLRADAVDILLSLGTEIYKANAVKILRDLGNVRGEIRTIYNFSQNVHNEQITQDLVESLGKIAQLKTMMIDNNEITYNYVRKCMEKREKELMGEKRDEGDEGKHDDKMFDESNDEHQKIFASLKRIDIDNARYSNMLLTTIMVKVWSHIHDFDEETQEELIKRLREELMDMAYTCSSGHVSRLVNVFSGFDQEYAMRISWEDQIVANMQGRLQKLIMNIEDEKEQELVLSEMTQDTPIEERTNFGDFFIKNLGNLRDELYEEFVTEGNHVNDGDFDLYFRRGVMKFEGYKDD